MERQDLAIPTPQNGRWSMNFVSDALSAGRKFRSLNIVDDFNRGFLAAEMDTSITVTRAVRVLERLRDFRALPQIMMIDNGPEFASSQPWNSPYDWYRKRGQVKANRRPDRISAAREVGGGKVSGIRVESGPLGSLGISREARMVPSVVRESSLHYNPDSQWHWAAESG